MIRPEWVEAGARAICGIAPGKCPNWDEHLEQATHILAAVDPLIRAEERERGAAVHMDEMDNMGADLLAAVQDLDAMRAQRDAVRADEAARHHDGGDCECVSAYTVEEFKTAIRSVAAECQMPCCDEDSR